MTAPLSKLGASLAPLAEQQRKMQSRRWTGSSHCLMQSTLKLPKFYWAISNDEGKDEQAQKSMHGLTAYFDEGGHASDPNLRYAGMAGFVASSSEWHVFEERWRDTLAKAGLTDAFHMKDFAHSQGQFKTWRGKEDQRRALFAQLIQLIRDTNAEPIGAAISLMDFETLTPAQQSGFKDPYYFAFQTCTRGAAIAAMFEPPDETVVTVYALNSEFGTSGGRAKELWD